MAQSVRCGTRTGNFQGSSPKGRVTTGGLVGLLEPRETRNSPGSRRVLLLGTALASLALAVPVLASPPAAAQATCQAGPPNSQPPAVFDPDLPITFISSTGDVACVNTDDRMRDTGAVILLGAHTGSYSIDLYNAGALSTTDGNGIQAVTDGPASSIGIVNTGDITVSSLTGPDAAIAVVTSDQSIPGSDIAIENAGRINMNTSSGMADYAIGIDARAQGGDVTITNSGAIEIASLGTAAGILGSVYYTGSSLDITNTGAIAISGEARSFGILASAAGQGLALRVENSSQVTAECSDCPAFGVRASVFAPDSEVSIVNSGQIRAESQSNSAYGIDAGGYRDSIELAIVSTGEVEAVTQGRAAYGIRALTFGKTAQFRS